MGRIARYSYATLSGSKFIWDRDPGASRFALAPGYSLLTLSASEEDSLPFAFCVLLSVFTFAAPAADAQMRVAESALGPRARTGQDTERYAQRVQSLNPAPERRQTKTRAHSSQ